MRWILRFLLTAVIGLTFLGAVLVPLAQLSGVPDWNSLGADQKEALVNIGISALGLWLMLRVVHFATRSRPVESIRSAATPAGAPARYVGHARKDDNSRPDPSGVIDQTRVRYHEAGHAAVALKLGFTLIEVSAVPNLATGSGGHVQIESHPAGNRSNTALWDKAIMCHGGLAAEKRFLADASAMGGTTDIQEAQLICSALAAARFTVDGKERTSGELLVLAAERADALVEECVEQVEALAGKLADGNRKLSGREAADVYMEAETPGS